MENCSDQTYYNLKTSFGPLEQPQQKEYITLVDLATGEKNNYLNGALLEVDSADSNTVLPALAGDSTVQVREFEPGAVLYGTYKQKFDDGGLGDPEEVYYRLVDWSIENLSSSNRGLTISVAPIGSHVSKIIYQYGVSASAGDPVDMGSGAYIDAIDYAGCEEWNDRLTYHSLLSGENCGFGYGWESSLYSRILAQGGVLVLQEGLKSAKFLKQEVLEGTIKGICGNGYIRPAGETGGIYVSMDGGSAIIFRGENGYVYENGSTKKYYDREGILQKTESASVTLHYSYVCDNGVLKEMDITKEESGKTLKFCYTDGQLTQTENQDNGISTFTYENGCLVTHTDPAGNTTTWNYDGEHRILACTGTDGTTFVKNEYDAKNRVISQTDGEGGVLRFAYRTEEGRLTADITDAFRTICQGHNETN